MPTPDELYRSPNALAPQYSRFRVSERLLLTGHSHQAWPDCALAGQQQAWLDAAECVDEKWERAFARADRVGRGFAHLLGDAAGEIALGQSTHELLLRFLSALPLARRPRIVTTDGEFHTARRQLLRLAEEGVELVRIPARPHAAVSEHLCAALDDRTAAVVVSSVLFESAAIVPDLGAVAAACQRAGAELLVDTYHHLGVVPFALAELGLESAFVTGGGYKYCQLGEGNCFLRVPPGCELRPVITGWFAEFSSLAARRTGERVSYGQGADRFAGATYDPTSHYRAAEVLDFFEREDLDAALLREISQHQVGLLAAEFDRLDVDPQLLARDRDLPLGETGGFLVLRSPRAAELCAALAARGVLTDSRGAALRLGPAPYLSDAQLRDAMALLGDAVRSL